MQQQSLLLSMKYIGDFASAVVAPGVPRRIRDIEGPCTFISKGLCQQQITAQFAVAGDKGRAFRNFAMLSHECRSPHRTLFGHRSDLDSDSRSLLSSGCTVAENTDIRTVARGGRCPKYAVGRFYVQQTSPEVALKGRAVNRLTILHAGILRLAILGTSIRFAALISMLWQKDRSDICLAR